MHKRYAGFTLIELLVVVSIIALLVAILLPSLNGARKSARRTVSATNIGGLIKALNIAAQNNNDTWPGANNANLRRNGVSVGSGGSDVDFGGDSGKIGYMRDDDLYTAPDPAGAITSVTRALWWLVKDGTATPSSFINGNTSDTADETVNVGRVFDFTSGDSISYSYQCPFGLRAARPSSNLAAGVAVMADRGPYYATGNDRTTGKRVTAVLAPTAIDETNLPDFDYEDPEAEGEASGTACNSPNEAGEGQNVGTTDASVKFHQRPTVGNSQDNIYTYGSNGATAADPEDFFNGEAGDGTTNGGNAATAAASITGPVVASDTYLIP